MPAPKPTCAAHSGHEGRDGRGVSEGFHEEHRARLQVPLPRCIREQQVQGDGFSTRGTRPPVHLTALHIKSGPLLWFERVNVYSLNPLLELIHIG